MHTVAYSLSMSLDGYIVGPDGQFNWSEPDPAVFDLATDEVRGVGVHLLGRHLYETMQYWETDEDPTWDEPLLEFAALWKALPKVVFSSTLATVDGSNARLASGGLAEEIERLRAEPGDADIAIGGATLAGQASGLDLIDEYRIRVYPVLVGGGLSYFSEHGRRMDLELVETRVFDAGVVYLRYRRSR